MSSIFIAERKEDNMEFLRSVVLHGLGCLQLVGMLLHEKLLITLSCSYLLLSSGPRLWVVFVFMVVAGHLPCITAASTFRQFMHSSI